MSTINVNFQITSVNSDRGTMLVKYWADGATVERFQADIGPYEITITPDMENLTTQNLNSKIATIGFPIVLRQKQILDLSNTLITTLTTEIDQEKSVPMSVQTEPTVIEA